MKSVSNSSDLVTILIPCLNEEKYILNCLRAVIGFNLPAGMQTEVLVLDGMSSDRTRLLIAQVSQEDARVRCIENPGRIQSKAINLGVSLAGGEWILRLDAHTVYPPDYLEKNIETAIRTGAANVGGLWVTKAGSQSYGAEIVQALTTHRFGVGDSPFRTARGEGPVDTVPFGLFRRSLFTEVGYFDERLARMEDYEFNSRLRVSGHTVWLNPAIQCSYYNQPSFGAFLHKQFFHEAPYNVYLWYLAPYAFAIRHAITAAFVAGIVSGCIFAPFLPLIRWVFAAIACLYITLAIVASLQQSLRYRRAMHFFTLPFSFFSFHFIHGLGMWWGGIMLLCGKAPVQKKQPAWPGATFFRWKSHSV